jgi:hypothetical protein
VPRKAHRGGEHETLAVSKKAKAKTGLDLRPQEGRLPRQEKCQNCVSRETHQQDLALSLLVKPQVSSSCSYITSKKLLLSGVLVTGWLFLSPQQAFAADPAPAPAEQVVLSPAHQAVLDALATANTEVNQALAASSAATPIIQDARTEYTQAVTATQETTGAVNAANTAVAAVDSAIAAVTSVSPEQGIDQSSPEIQDAKTTVTTADAAIDNIATQANEAQTEITQAATARSAAVTATQTAQTELTQANVAINNAQDAVNAMQSTIATTVNVLAGVDDAGVRMNLPFGMQMGGTVYNDVFVGSNATITFGVNEGPNYYSTPSAPSVSIAGWDWTTWSTGTGITYSTTATSLDIAWDLRVYPLMDMSTQMTQVRFFADVNPTSGAWVADVSVSGPIPNGSRFQVREVTNGPIDTIADTNEGPGFNGQIGQGNYVAPATDPNANNSAIQDVIDSANVTISQLNSSISTVVATNTSNQSLLNQTLSTASLSNTVNSALTTQVNLSTALETKFGQLISAIANNVPTPAPILAEPIVEGTTVTITPELPQGYTPNTWFFQVITDDPEAENPYGNSATTNTDGAPETIVIEGLTEGATYTIRVANWSGPTSVYTETTVTIPVSASLRPAPAPEPVDPGPSAEEQAAQEEANAAAEAEAAAAEAAAAEAEAAAAQAEAEAAAAEQAAAEAEEAAQAAEEAAAQAEAEAQAAEEAAQAAEEAAAEAEQEAAEAEAEAEQAQQEAEQAEAAAEEVGLEPNSPDSLPTDEPKLPDAEDLVARVQEDIAGVENGGIEFFGTKDQPQVIGEDGKLTPPPPAPGSGDPIHPDAITVAETFIGQPGGMTFNSPDVAVPVVIKPICVTMLGEDGSEIHVDTDGNEHLVEECTFLPGALEGIPGAAVAAALMGEAFENLANIGNDMSPVTRKKAKKVLLATIVVGQIVALRRRFG